AEDSEIRLTFTGSSTLYNGRFGWIYEEELGLMDGWAWSPDGTKIAFFEVDEAQVPVVLISNFDDLHTTPELVRYPKAGDPNPVVRIGVLNGVLGVGCRVSEAEGDWEKAKGESPIPNTEHRTPEYLNTRVPEDPSQHPIPDPRHPM